MRLRSSVNSGWQLAGWALPGKPAALLLGPEPAIATWINQDQLIDGQQPWNTLPLILSKDSDCLRKWRKADGWKFVCR